MSVKLVHKNLYIIGKRHRSEVLLHTKDPEAFTESFQSILRVGDRGSTSFLKHRGWKSLVQALSLLLSIKG